MIRDILNVGLIHRACKLIVISLIVKLLNNYIKGWGIVTIMIKNCAFVTLSIYIKHLSYIAKITNKFINPALCTVRKKLKNLDTVV